MAVKDPSNTETLSLVNSRSNRSGWLWAEAGLKPFYFWLMSTLFHLDAATVADFLVKRDDASATTVRVLAGRCAISGTGASFAGQAVDLAAYNNATANLALVVVDGAPAINVASTWPGGTHHKLASVTLAAGQITAMVDRRFEKHFSL